LLGNLFAVYEGIEALYKAVKLLVCLRFLYWLQLGDSPLFYPLPFPPRKP
jgi:hypothetical protein